MKNLKITALLVLISPAVSGQNFPPEPVGLPPEVIPLDFIPTNISGDGTTVIGIPGRFRLSGTEGAAASELVPIWMLETGTTNLFPSGIPGATDIASRGISGDGRYVGGVYNDSSFRTNGFILDRQNPGGIRLYNDMIISDISDSGTSAVGRDTNSQLGSWIPNLTDPRVVLAPVPGTMPMFNEVVAMDAAGTRAAGYQQDFVENPAVYWNLTGPAPVAIPIPKLPSQQMTSFSSASDISRNGNYIVGQQQDGQSLFDRPFIYTVGGDITEIPALGARVNGVSNTGRVVGSSGFRVISATATDLDQVSEAEVMVLPSRSGAFVFDEVSGVRSINQWLSDSGVDIGPVFFGSANAISEDGKVIVGTFGDIGFNGDARTAIAEGDDEPRPTAGYIAREGSGAINPGNFIPTLGAGGQPTTLTTNLMNLIFHGAHHVPLQMMGANRHAWITGDFARNDVYDSDSFLAEAGAAVDLMDKQLVAGGAIGQSWVDQDLVLGGDVELSGQYLLGELSFRATDTPFIFTLTGAIGEWDADIQRNYLNGAVLNSSFGDTDVSSGSLRLRFDWLDAFSFGGFGFTPKLAYRVTHTDMDGYSEVGGGFPAVFNGQDETAHEFRYGLSASRTLLDERGTLRIRAEGVHRFDDNGAATTGQVVGLFPFNLPGQSVKQDWFLFGVDFDYMIAEGLTLTSGLSTSTSGQDPVFGGTLGFRKVF